MNLPLWFWPLLMCLILAGIHGYLGIHVLKRKVIFVDLAMAQVAALGAAYGILLGYDPNHEGNALPLYLFSLAFTLVGAAVIALVRMRQERVPQEAFIGIVYASASALTILLLSKTPTEGEQIKHMLVGSLFSVKWEKVALTAGIYAGVGLFHWVFRRNFFLISEDPEGAARDAGLSIRLWDFLFYVSFGFVITSSVSIAGVLLVFSYLVVPAVIAQMFANRTRVRVVTAWGVGAVVSVAGMSLSYAGDYPTGPSIVAGFTIALMTAGALHYVLKHGPLARTLPRLALGAAVALLAIWGTTFLRKDEDAHSHRQGDVLSQLLEALKSDDENVVVDALDHIEKTKDSHAIEPVVVLVRGTRSDRVLEKGAHTLATLQAPGGSGVLKEAARRDLDPDLKVHLAEALLDLRDAAGFLVLIEVLEARPPDVVRDEALRLLEARTGAALRAIAEDRKLRTWWAERGSRLRWRGGDRWSD